MDRPYLAKDLGDHWRTVYPEVTELYDELFYEAIEQMGQEPLKAERKLKKIITACGNGHLDAILHLGLLLNDRNKPIEGNALITKAYILAKEAIPADFIPGYDDLLWSHFDNRPVLQSLWSFGMECQQAKDYERAIKEFNFCMRLNPCDDKGLRYLLLECYQELNRYEAILELEKEYEGDYSVDFYYGKVLALWYTGRKAEASEQLEAAKSTFPHVASELLASDHQFPFDEFEEPYFFDGTYPLGSRQEAHHYWMKTRKLWESSPELIDFLKKHLH
jgi:tetratricopeptide (TPR) repeat protein